jgi:alkanesulfonate monooxygenase SsuD/methylene tetrahydromethanopterin reductase-like flavin-dependent oxidoreductase (luciferase family)
VVEAKLYSRPEQPVPIYGAAVSEATARFCGGWADGLLTTGGNPEAVRRVIAAFREGGGEEKPIVVQAALCWAPSEDEAMSEAMDQWRACLVGGEVNWDLRRPQDFERIAKLVSASQVREYLPISSRTDLHLDWMEALCALNIDELHLHQVGRNQERFVEKFGREVLPHFA